MSKDNRIFKPELMNEQDKKVMNEALDSFYEKNYGKGVEERIQKARENNPNIITVDGKLYDKRYYKGGN